MSKLSLTQQEEAIRLYTTEPNISGADIARIYGVERMTINQFLRKQGILTKKTKRYPFNEKFFDIIDTEEKAYFLGLMMADGYNNIKRYAIRLVLQKGDKDIIEKFYKIIECKRPLIINQRSKNDPKRQDTCELYLTSQHMSKKLQELGCDRGKTYNLEFPNVSKVPFNLIRHFIRGFFDGDGCFTWKSKGKTYTHTVSMAVTVNFGKIFKQIVEKELNINCSNRNLILQSGNVMSSIIMNNIHARKFMEWIFKDATIYLDRKYIHYNTFKEKFTEYYSSKNKSYIDT